MRPVGHWPQILPALLQNNTAWVPYVKMANFLHSGTFYLKHSRRGFTNFRALSYRTYLYKGLRTSTLCDSEFPIYKAEHSSPHLIDSVENTSSYPLNHCRKASPMSTPQMMSNPQKSRTDQNGTGRAGSPGRNKYGPEARSAAPEHMHRNGSTQAPLKPDGVQLAEDVKRKNDAISQKAIIHIVAQHHRPKQYATATEAVIRQVFFLRASSSRVDTSKIVSRLTGLLKSKIAICNSLLPTTMEKARLRACTISLYNRANLQASRFWLKTMRQNRKRRRSLDAPATSSRRLCKKSGESRVRPRR